MSFFTDENSRRPLFSTPQTPIRRDTATSTETLNDNCCGCGTWSSSKKSKIGKGKRPLQIKSRKQLFSRANEAVKILPEEQDSQVKTPSVHDPDKTSENSSISSISTGLGLDNMIVDFLDKYIEDQKPQKKVILENNSAENKAKHKKNRTKKSSHIYLANSSLIAGSNVNLNSGVLDVSNCSSIPYEFTDETGAVYNSPDLQESCTLVESTLKRSISSEIERNRMASCSPHLNNIQNLHSITYNADTSLKSPIFKVSPPAPANTPENSLTSSGDSGPLVAPANTLDIVTNSSSSLVHPSSSDSRNSGIVNNIQNVTIGHPSGERQPTNEHHDSLSTKNENRSRNPELLKRSSLNVEKSSKKVSNWLRQIDPENYKRNLFQDRSDHVRVQMPMLQEGNLAEMKVSDFDTPGKNARRKTSAKRRHHRHHDDDDDDDELYHQKMHHSPDYGTQRDAVNAGINHQFYSCTPLRAFFPPILSTPFSNIPYLQAPSIPIPICILPTNPVVISHPQQQHFYASAQPPPPPPTPTSSKHHHRHHQPRNSKAISTENYTSPLPKTPTARQTLARNRIKTWKTCNKPDCMSRHVTKKTAERLQNIMPNIRKFLRKEDKDRGSPDANNPVIEVKMKI